MDLIHPAEISGKIMTLIDQAKEELIIVSPYNKFTYWKKLTQRIEKAQQRGIRIQWYIRKDIPHNVEQIRQIGVEPIEVENLHCKMYLNDQHAVVTSMNLHQFSDSSSIDIGYLITEEEKYKELRDFISTYIDSNSINKDKEVEVINTPSNLDHGRFIDSLVQLLLELGFEKDNIGTEKGKYGPIVYINQFIDSGFVLIFEPKGGYYRIDLRINYHYRIKNALYRLLSANEIRINQSIGFPVSFGNQMKRLKLDLVSFSNYKYENWGRDELEILRPILQKVMETYRKEITNAVQQCIGK